MNPIMALAMKGQTIAVITGIVPVSTSRVIFNFIRFLIVAR